ERPGAGPGLETSISTCFLPARLSHLADRSSRLPSREADPGQTDRDEHRQPGVGFAFLVPPLAPRLDPGPLPLRIDLLVLSAPRVVADLVEHGFEVFKLPQDQIERQDAD